MVRRVVDVVICSVVFVVLSPLIGLIALLIRLDSPGPAIFKQKRVGRFGRTFWMYKFRTMFHEAEGPEPNMVRANDPRITDIGQLLRATKLDELPQLINVIVGDMSIVGIRPEYDKHLAHFTDEEKELLTVRPGLIGPSQLLHLDETTAYPPGVDHDQYYVDVLMHQKLEMELEYLRKRSFLADLSLFCRIVGNLANRMLRVDLIYANYRRVLLFFADGLLVAGSFWATCQFIFGFSMPPEVSAALYTVIPMVVVLRLLTFIVFGLYRGVYRYASITDLLSIIKATGFSTGLIICMLYLAVGNALPGSVIILDALLVFCLVAITRFIVRIYRELSIRATGEWKKTLVVGPVDFADVFLRQLRSERCSTYHVVGLINDDLSLRGMRLHGIKIFGNIEHLVETIRLLRIEILISPNGGPWPQQIQERLEIISENPPELLTVQEVTFFNAQPVSQ